MSHTEVLRQVEGAFAPAAGRGLARGVDLGDGGVHGGEEKEDAASPCAPPGGGGGLLTGQRRFLRSFASAVQCWQRSPLAPPSGFQQGVG